MKKINLLVIIVGLLMACNSEDEKAAELNKNEMLTGGSSKDWYEAETSYDQSGEFEECKIGAEMRTDNTFTFSADGTIEHDRGTVTSYSAPDGNGGCSDLINYIGEWKFLENETKFSWLIKYKTGNPDDINPDLEPEIWNLVNLSEDELILGMEFNGVEETITYRAK